MWYFEREVTIVIFTRTSKSMIISQQRCALKKPLNNWNYINVFLVIQKLLLLTYMFKDNRFKKHVMKTVKFFITIENKINTVTILWFYIGKMTIPSDPIPLLFFIKTAPILIQLFFCIFLQITLMWVDVLHRFYGWRGR